jgi:hypothetical protein
MEVTRQGETKVIEVDRSSAHGGVGLGGSAGGPTSTVGAGVSDGGDDDTDIREVTTVASETGSGGGAASTTSPQSSPTPSAGDAAETWKSTAATDATTDAADRYCGNCEHFEYVRTERGIQPYCGFHDGVMADMDACEDWSGR